MNVVLQCNVPILHLGDTSEERVAALTGSYSMLDDLWIVTGMHPIPNRHDDPQHDFAVEGRDLNPLIQQGLVVIGAVHSHLEFDPPWPSEADIDGLPPGMIGAVYKDRTLWWYTGRRSRR